MHRGTSELIGCNVLTQHALHNARPCEAKERVLGLDQEAPLSGEIASPTGVEAEHAHDAGHDTADLPQRSKGIGVAVKATHSRRNVSASGVV